MIENLNLSLRAYNGLKRAGIHTIEELLNAPVEYIFSIRGLGEKSVEEIYSRLKEVHIDETDTV